MLLFRSITPQTATMIDSVFNEIEKSKQLDWGVIYLGCQGLPIGNISAKNVSNYASTQLIETLSSEESFVSIAELSFCTQITSDTINMLGTICKIKQIYLTESRKKWLLFSLQELLNDLPNDILYGPLKLNQFWLEWGDLKESPNIIQGVNNSLTPNEFYSRENFNSMILNHRLWLNNELNLLKPE